MNFSDVPTPVLAQETLRRSRDVWSVNERLFLWFGITVLTISVVWGVVLLLDLEPLWGFGASIACGAVPAAFWVRALGRCAKYTQEMRARAAELKRRNGTAP